MPGRRGPAPELEGTALLTDPLLRGRIGHVQRIAAPVPVLPHVDAVLVSHAHRDHLDLPSLRRLPRSVPVLAAPAAAAGLRRSGRPVRAMIPGDRARVGQLDVIAVEA